MQAAHVAVHGRIGPAWSTQRNNDLKRAKWSHPGALIQALMSENSPSDIPQGCTLNQQSMLPIPHKALHNSD